MHPHLRRPLLVRASLASVALAFAAAHAPAQQQVVETYRYDAAGRLTRVTYDGKTTISLKYDENGLISDQNVTPNPPASSSGGGSSSGLCFIATAAYGSPLDPHVQTLRDFRDQHLRTNAPGRAFVGFYERVSPPIAAVIARHDSLRSVARLLLAPLVYSVAYPKTAALLACVAFAGWLAWRRRRRLRGPQSPSAISIAVVSANLPSGPPGSNVTS